jgi:acetyl esterase/lipase
MRRFLIAFTLLAGIGRAEGGGIHVIPDVAYLGPGRAEKADVYLPASALNGALAPAVVWIHGGSFTAGDKARATQKNISTDLAAAGYVVASVNYRLGNGAWPQNILDCKNAVRFLRAHAGDYGIDPKRIAVAGDSAGGYLALMVGFTEGNKQFEPDAPYPGVSSRVRAIIDFYGPADFLTRQQCASDGSPTGKPRNKIVSSFPVFGAETRDDEVFRTASAVGYVTKDSPPVLIGQGRSDPEVDYLQSVELARVLEEHGVTHELILLDGVGHAFDFETWRRKPLPRDMRAAVISFLANHAGMPAGQAAAIQSARRDTSASGR